MVWWTKCQIEEYPPKGDVYMKDVLVSLAEKIKENACRKGFDEAAVLAVRNNEVMIKIANSQPSVIQHWSNIVINLYLVKNKRIFVTSYTLKNPDEVLKAIDDILNVSESVEQSEYYAPLPEPSRIDFLKGITDKRVIDALKNPEKVVDKLFSALSSIKVDETAGVLTLEYEGKALATSTGVSLYEEATGFNIYIRAFKDEGSGQWGMSSSKLDLKLIEETVNRATEYAVESRRPEPLEPGVYDIILSPMVAGNLLSLIGFMASAMAIDMGFSIFMGKKLGEKVASDKLTLIDDPRLEDAYNSASFDDEGVPTYTKPIIEKGILKNILHNTKTAKKHGTKSTGNAGWIMPEPWNLVVQAGDLKEDELIGEVKRGLLVTNNWYTRLQNYIDGTFSTILRDAIFLIENGRIVKATSKLRIADKLPRLLSNIVALGKESYQAKWWEIDKPVITPFILVRNVHTSKHTL